MEHGQTASTERLQQLTGKAREQFGDDAKFMYFSANKQAFTMTFEQAIAVCGEHIADAPDAMVMGMLEKMYDNAIKFEAVAEKNPEAARRYKASLSRGEEALARRALDQE